LLSPFHYLLRSQQILTNKERAEAAQRKVQAERDAQYLETKFIVDRMKAELSPPPPLPPPLPLRRQKVSRKSNQRDNEFGLAPMRESHQQDNDY